MLELKNIVKQYNPGTVNEKTIFQNFNLRIPSGQFVTIIGSNGSGKTTLLNLICGNLKPNQGEIILDQNNITALPEHERYIRIGRVFQDPAAGTCPSMTLLENLSLADNKNKSWNLSKAVTNKRIDFYQEMLKKVGLNLENKLDDIVGSFSGGERQAIALLMATMTPIDYLILDEHTAALDPKAAENIIHLTSEIIEEHSLTTLMVTHNLNYALEYGDRLIMMHKGEILVDVLDKAKTDLELQEILNKFFEISIEVGNAI